MPRHENYAWLYSFYNVQYFDHARSTLCVFLTIDSNQTEIPIMRQILSAAKLCVREQNDNDNLRNTTRKIHFYSPLQRLSSL